MDGADKDKANKKAVREHRSPSNLTGEKAQPIYTPEHLSQLDYQRDLGDPGEFPYTRGVYPNMVPGQALDHASVLRIRQRKGNESPLQIPPRTGSNGPLHCL